MNDLAAAFSAGWRMSQEANGYTVHEACATYLGHRQASRADVLPAIGSDLLCAHCAKQFCPHAEPMHFDKDGCPSCEAAE